MNDAPRRQIKPRREFCLTGSATLQGTTEIEQHRTGRGMDRTVDTAATQQAGIRGIDDGIHSQRGDVLTDDLEHACPLTV